MQDNLIPPQNGMPNGNVSPSPSEPCPPPVPQWANPPKRRGIARKIFLSLCIVALIVSVIINVVLLAGMATKFEVDFDHSVIQRGSSDQVVAVYSVNGMIDNQAARRFSQFYRQVHQDRRVKAIILRVDSPGGSVSASDQIHNFVQQLRQSGKTVVISMGGVAASGGYYISAGADEIVAEPTTVTGSIGVIMSWPVLSGTLKRIGVETVVLKSTHARGWKDEASWLKEPAGYQRQHLQEVLDTIQTQFEDVVRQGRRDRLKTRSVSYNIFDTVGAAPQETTITETEPFNGKIYLADEAKQLGLIDMIGYTQQAIDRAVELADLKHPRIVRYQRRRGLISELMQAKSSSLLGLAEGSLDDLQRPRMLLLWRGE